MILTSSKSRLSKTYITFKLMELEGKEEIVVLYLDCQKWVKGKRQRKKRKCGFSTQNWEENEGKKKSLMNFIVI